MGCVMGVYLCEKQRHKYGHAWDRNIPHEFTRSQWAPPDGRERLGKGGRGVARPSIPGRAWYARSSRHNNKKA